MAQTTDATGIPPAEGAAELCNRTWWVFLIGGIASLLFGLLAFVNPGIALFVLATFFAAYILVDGAANIWGAIRHRGTEGWWMLLLFGVLGVIVGGYSLVVPPVSMLAFVYVVAFIALLTGVSSLYLGWKLRRQISTEWILYVTGILSVLFGLLIVLQPVIGGLYVVYVIAAWAVMTGLLRIWLAFRMRRLRHRLSAA